ncbi:hypothetical protein CAPTEDRAFT_228383 [Capitella teleta]|uniref:CUB domain-containing protein n=1 Tax=Capitella teleta TaxID=283909 RepID=R7V6Z2_CAPTE|nr:hypothetical protein CAPTEDRAFT_228383 [Capitella teleta]|eukprot:ELU11540.1 hypothetical protein CAPTEDRAFT_228383 [Capitella teleta]
MDGVASAWHCNETVDLLAQPTLTRSLVSYADSQQGKPLYCWFRFQADVNQTVQVDVKCEQGYLRISDKEVCSTDPEWLPPTTLCGRYEKGEVRVKRYTQGPSAFVEFKVDEAEGDGGYEFDVTFMDKESDDNLPYGHLNRHDGLIRNTKCDWLIPVNRCVSGQCHVVSPLYPGIYPMNTRCRYLFTNFDEDRIELVFAGNRFSGKFDLKRDHECLEDYIEIHDGTSSVDPLLGRWCGQEGAHIISSGSSLLLIFQTGPGGPPWDYSGFDIVYHDRWKNEHEGGQRVAGTLCDWEFDSSRLMRRDIQREFHSPDHRLPPGTVCSFDFYGQYNEVIEISLGVYGTDETCSEKIDVYDGEKHLATVCPSQHKKPTKQTFEYMTSGPDARVTVTSANGQISDADPTWVYYTFVETDYTGTPPTSTPASRRRGAGYKQVGGESAEVREGSGGQPRTTSIALISWFTILTLSVVIC